MTQLSNIELNKLVAQVCGFEMGYGWINGADGLYDYIVVPSTPDQRKRLPDYCGNPDDAWELVKFLGTDLSSQYPNWYMDESPFRTVVICFLQTNGVLPVPVCEKQAQQFFVCKTHSHTNSNCLWSVESNTIGTLNEAKQCLARKSLNSEEEYFIVTRHNT